jgi:phosphopantetheinyl transferase (holo-ACP synthase)
MRALGSAWLTPNEQTELARLTDSGRRGQWLAGRWTAKQLVVKSGLGTRIGDIEIRTRDVLARGCRPQVRIGGRRLDASLSIAHTARGAIVALARGNDTSVGVDLVDLADPALVKLAGTSDRGFSRLWFTPLERSWLSVDPPRRAATLWAIKEAVYKACHCGEAWSPSDVAILPGGAAAGDGVGGFRCFYRGRAIVSLNLDVREFDDQLAVVASSPRATVKLADSRINTSRFSNSRSHELILGFAS